MSGHDLLDAVKKLLPHAEAEQENLYAMAKKQPDEYQAGYEDCRHAVSYAYEAVSEAERLRGAGPDMLYALKNALDVMEVQNVGLGGSQALARAAIATAESNERDPGRAPAADADESAVDDVEKQPGNSFEMSCPKCGSGERIDIAATVWVRLTPDGTDADLAADGGHFWEDDSAGRCVACDHQGTVRDFDPDERERSRDDQPARERDAPAGGILEALKFCDMTLADLEASKRKGYIAEAIRLTRDALASVKAEPGRPDSIYERYPGLTREAGEPSRERDSGRSR
jgi:hypothetical protein